MQLNANISSIWVLRLRLRVRIYKIKTVVLALMEPMCGNTRVGLAKTIHWVIYYWCWLLAELSHDFCFIAAVHDLPISQQISEILERWKQSNIVHKMHINTQRDSPNNIHTMSCVQSQKCTNQKADIFDNFWHGTGWHTLTRTPPKLASQCETVYRQRAV